MGEKYRPWALGYMRHFNYFLHDTFALIFSKQG
jgi:hypothetical protein